LFHVKGIAGNPQTTASDFLQSWQAGDYRSMYELLSRESKSYISRGEFKDQYRNFAREFIFQDFEIIGTIHTGRTARVEYRLQLTKVGSGESISKRGLIDFIIDCDEWKIFY
jgi:hypothetical protein